MCPIQIYITLFMLSVTLPLHLVPFVLLTLSSHDEIM